MKFDVILVDPPWSYYGSPTKMGAVGKEYPTMTPERICNLPIKGLCHPRSICFLWVTSVHLELGLKVLSEWGLHYRGIAFVWVKTKKDGTPIGAQGVRPSIVKPLSEFVLVGSPLIKGRPLPLSDESIQQTVLAPKREHSRKPDEVQNRIDRMYPNMKKLELFSRQSRRGWTQLGNERYKYDPS